LEYRKIKEAELSGDSTYKIKDHKSYVKIKYQVRVVDGPILKGAGQPEEMDFVTGYAQVVPGLEKRIIGAGAGESLSFTVAPDEAFGPRIPELVIEKKREEFHFPPGYAPYIGMEIPLVGGGESPDTAMIKEIKTDTIVIDVNHPLAGKSLQYHLEIIEARPAGSDDICGEWELESERSSCASGDCSSGECSSVCQFVLGKEPSPGGGETQN
jgi:FKBP-type peptidyl-prolyl cis-trans isomerase SlyD